jgi:hypothetical protein
MAHPPTAVERIDGWKEIARYLGRDVTTAIRWEKLKGLPVHRVPGGKRQAVFCYTHEIDAWLRQDSSDLAPSNSFSIRAAESPAGTGAEPQDVFHDIPPGMGLPGQQSSPGVRPILLAALAGLTLAFAVLTWLFWPDRIYPGDDAQITNDGAIKTHLVTDGRNLYMGEWRGGRIALTTVPVDGGTVREIPTPFNQTLPLAISHDGQQLLVLAGEGEEQEKALWTVSLSGDPPRPVGKILCHAAAWSPRDQQIAYSFGTAVYLAGADGGSSREIYNSTSIPLELQWSLDGQRLIMLLRDPSTWNSVIRELRLPADRSGVVSLRPLVTDPQNYASFSPVIDDRDDFFLGAGGEPSGIFVVQQPRLPWISRTATLPFTHQTTQANDFALDRAHHKLYVLKDVAAHNELEWYDRGAREFHPFLPGLSARDVDFSRDGKWVAWVREPDNTLWVAPTAGGSPRQVPTPGKISVALPRWSPDGQQIALMAKTPDGPYRIYVVPAAGGPLAPASHGSDNQGAPTWSPDGSSLVYGRVLCEEDRSCAIQEINLATGEQTLIPGSEALSTARWSPDGRFIAALRADQHEVWVLDRRSDRWKKLAEGVNGNDLAWARDSRFIYASRPQGEKPELLRISPETGAVDTAVDLTDFTRLNGRIDTWFAMTPDDSFIFLRIVAGHEVYALTYR